MLSVVATLLLLSHIGSSNEVVTCPDLFKRFNYNHTFCLPANKSCTIVNRGISAEDREYILQLHNEYRNKVATGQESDAGGLPSAANMLKMIWDDELAAIAQKLADSCHYAHDCANCRKVQSFSVGQNIGLVSNIIKPLSSADWLSFIRNLYNEVVYFNRNYVKMYLPGPSDHTQYGHFTQMMWATSWKIGCGWTLFEDGEKFQSLTACNYGPGGNLIEGELYEAGEACSNCPKNSCCGISCEKYNITATYQGLCEVIEESESPEGPGPHGKGNYSFYCDFNKQSDCKVSFTGKPWMMVRTPGGNWLSNILKGGEKTKLKFNNTFEISGNLCFKLLIRSGPNVDGEAISGEGFSTFDTGLFQSVFKLKNKDILNYQDFVLNTYKLSLPEGNTYKFQYSFDFLVPAESPEQFVEINQVSATVC